MTDPQQDFDDLAREIMAFRWSIDLDDQAKREPSLAHFLSIELSPSACERLSLHVRSLRRFWERTQSDDWNGWSSEEDVFLAETDVLAEGLTQVELDDFDSRHRGISWQIGMWKVYQDLPFLKVDSRRF